MKKSNFFKNLPRKIEIFLKFAWKSRIFCEIAWKKSKFLGNLPGKSKFCWPGSTTGRPPRFQTRLTPLHSGNEWGKIPPADKRVREELWRESGGEFWQILLALGLSLKDCFQVHQNLSTLCIINSIIIDYWPSSSRCCGHFAYND